MAVGRDGGDGRVASGCSGRRQCSATQGQLEVTSAVIGGSSATQLGAPWNGTTMEVFDAVEPRHDGFGEEVFDLENVELVWWSEEDAMQFCENGMINREKFAPGRILLLPQEVNDNMLHSHACSLDSKLWSWSMYYLQILPRVLMVNDYGRFAGYGPYKIDDLPIQGGFFVVGRPGRDWQGFKQAMNDFAATRGKEEFIIARGNLSSRPNHFVEFLKSPLVLAVQQYGAFLVYLYLAIFAVQTLRARSGCINLPQVTVILYANAFTNALLAVAHALDGGGFVSPGMPYAWTGFFRTELGAQTIALDYLIVVVWDIVLKRCLESNKAVTANEATGQQPSSSHFCKDWGVAMFLSLYGWVVAVLNADVGVTRYLLFVLPSINSVAQAVVAVTLWSKSNKLLRAIRSKTVLHNDETFRRRQQMFLNRVARAGKISAVASLISILILGCASLYFFSSPMAMFLTQTSMMLARFGNSYSQILFCVKPGGSSKVRMRLFFRSNHAVSEFPSTNNDKTSAVLS